VYCVRKDAGFIDNYPLLITVLCVVPEGVRIRRASIGMMLDRKRRLLDDTG
jgi:hypothetical protein